jgi:hypothetical protein
MRSIRRRFQDKCLWVVEAAEGRRVQFDWRPERGDLVHRFHGTGHIARGFDFSAVSVPSLGLRSLDPVLTRPCEAANRA